MAKKMTQKQRNLLARLRVPTPWPRTKHGASQAITAHLEAMRVARMRTTALDARLAILLDE